MQANAFPKGPNGRRDSARVEAVLPAVLKQIALLDRVVRNSEGLAGSMFSIADMYLMPILSYLRIFPESSKAIAESQSLDRYFRNWESRESFAKTEPPPPRRAAIAHRNSWSGRSARAKKRQ
jgi:glutathione S-transferase